MTAVLQQLVQNTTNPDVLGQLMTPEARYVSFNFENSELKRIMPWAGTHKGAQSLPKVFAGIQSFWKTLDFKVTDTIEQDNRVAFFGSFNSLLAIRIRRGRGAGVPSAGEEKQNRYAQPLAESSESGIVTRRLELCTSSRGSRNTSGRSRPRSCSPRRSR